MDNLRWQNSQRSNEEEVIQGYPPQSPVWFISTIVFTVDINIILIVETWSDICVYVCVCHRVGHQLPELGCEEPGRPGGPDGSCEEGQQLPHHRVGELRGIYG